MKIIRILKLAASIILCQLAGFLGSLFTTPAIPIWYESLHKPFLLRPIGYSVRSGSAYLYWWESLYSWSGGGKITWRSKPLWFFSLFNYFSISLVGSLFWTQVTSLRSHWYRSSLDRDSIDHPKFLKVSRMAALLLVPYLVWVSFAAILNFSLWILNGW